MPLSIHRLIDLNLDLDHDLNLAFLKIFSVRALISQFGHETLNVYQEPIRFITWISERLETIPKNLAVHNQLESEKGERSTVPDCFDVDRINTCQFGAKCLRRKIKIMIKIEIKIY